MTDQVPALPSQGISFLAELERTGAITAVSLTLPPDVPLERCEALFGMFGQLHEMTAWLIGDLINYTERVYGETYAQAAEATGLSEHTLINYASICSRIPRSRRRKRLKFSHHAEVAYMPPVEQAKWLKQAEDQGWKRRELREALVPVRELAKTAKNNGPVSSVEVEILPPARHEVLESFKGDEPHICICPRCARRHRDDEDVK